MDRWSGLICKFVQLLGQSRKETQYK